METAPAGMVDLYHSLLVCGMWAAFLMLQLLKPPRWLQIGVGAVLLVLLVSNWFWPQHVYMLRRTGRPLSIALDVGTIVFVLAFLAVIIRAAERKQPSG